MKSTFILFFLLLNHIVKAQTSDVIEEIKETKNKKLIEYLEKQEPIFDELENYLTEISQQEFNAKNDSINSIKFDNLLRLYLQIEQNSNGIYKISKSKKQFALVKDYLKTHLENVDELYATFTSKRFEEKKDFEVTNYLVDNNISLDGITEKRPVYEPCVGNENENLCTADFIRKKVMNNYNVPYMRNIGNQKLKTVAQIVINKSGQIVFTTNKESCGYFEYDMELIRVFNKAFIKDKFIPAQQNGKIVKCSYALPVNVQTE